MSAQERREAIRSQVCKLLRQEREKRGLSMTVLAQRSGLAQQAVSYIEREMRVPNLDTLLRLTHALGLELSEVLQGGNKW